MDGIDLRVEKIGEDKIDNAILPPEGDSRLRPVPSERLETGPFTSSHHDAENFRLHAGLLSWYDAPGSEALYSFLCSCCVLCSVESEFHCIPSMCQTQSMLGMVREESMRTLCTYHEQGSANNGALYLRARSLLPATAAKSMAGSHRAAGLGASVP